MLALVLLALPGCKNRSIQSRDAAKEGASTGGLSAAVWIPATEGDPVWGHRRLFSLGDPNGPNGAIGFGQLTAIAVSSNYTLYTLDAQQRVIKVFDAQGNFVKAAGGPGGGPGEFNAPFGLHAMTLVGDSLLAVFDDQMNRVVLFRQTGAFERIMPVDMPSLPRRGFVLALADLGDGNLLVETRFGFGTAVPPGKDGASALLKVSMNSLGLDTLVQFRDDDVVFRTISANLGELFPKPFSPKWHWAVSPAGRIAWAQGTDFDVTILSDSWQPIGRLTSPLLGREVTPRDVAEFRERFLDGDGPYQAPGMRMIARQVLKSLQYPRRWPAVDALIFDSQGQLWIRTPPSARDTLAEWNVFDTSLRHIARVQLPANERLRAVVQHRAYTTWRGNDGVDHVTAYELK